ncbi:metal ABC transporter substrate-binding protein [Nocardioides acrostichi]|uniref:Zinc ABC transporter substrate-binding protein n=1 Tax=Nocardioides acrostichi TaxID=2784339 RepID=A0A930V471_9ACTN|nr:metal ABC transporter substrate-binding protein [Nocardioides acrostichi]MBF4163410.1 zinc ABC transporter substrate-binding protein [Nocardioides acrostichi]
MRSLPTRPARRPRIAVILAMAIVAAAGLSGCSAFSETSTSADGKVDVAAAFYPLEFVTQRVGGDLVDVTDLTQPGQEPHDLELSVAETAAISEADLVVYESVLQPNVGDAVDQNATGTDLDVADVVHLKPFVPGEAHDEETHPEGDDDTSTDTSTDEHDHDHDHGELDPHFWQNPLLLAKVAEAVAADLAKIDPDHASTYQANADKLVDELQQVNQEFTQGLSQCERSTIVVSHDAFGYLERYGLTVEGIAGLSPDAEPTPADLGRLQKLIESDGITTVFSETLAPPALSETLAKDAGVTTAVLDPIEGLTDATADEDYLSLMRENLAALEKANGCS